MVTKKKKLDATFEQMTSSIIDGGTNVTVEDMAKAQRNVVVGGRKLGRSDAEIKDALSALGIAEKVVPLKIRVRVKDETLPHQIVLAAGRTVNETAVSCNCLRLAHGGLKPMGFVANGEGTVDQLKAIYEQPINHNNSVFPFSTNIDWADQVEVEV